MVGGKEITWLAIRESWSNSDGPKLDVIHFQPDLWVCGGRSVDSLPRKEQCMAKFRPRLECERVERKESSIRSISEPQANACTHTI